MCFIDLLLYYYFTALLLLLLYYYTLLFYLRVDVGVLAVADHLGALLHVLLQVLLVRVEERRHGRLQDAGEHLDLKGGQNERSKDQLVMYSINQIF